MPSLVLARGLLGEIRRIVYGVPFETGVRLVGFAREQEYAVRHIIGPGERAIHRRNRYECDNDYATRRFAELLKREPQLEFLGELHVHVDGDPRLSSTDIATVRRVLRDFPFFIAGVILRHPFRISPVLFNRSGVMRMNCVLQ